jgi:hypothetical protein
VSGLPTDPSLPDRLISKPRWTRWAPGSLSEGPPLGRWVDSGRERRRRRTESYRVSSARRALAGTRRRESDGAPHALAAFQEELDWTSVLVK